MAASGKGRRTRQYNKGAHSLGAYVAAASQHRRGAHDKGGKVIHDTPASKRSEYAREIWALRRKHGTDRFSDFDWETGKKVKRNAGKGRQFTFHGAFTKKADAVAKEREVGGFIREAMVKGQKRYMVMKKNPGVLSSALAGAAMGAVRGILNPFKRRKKQNPSAATVYSDFHGKEPSEVLAYQEALLAAGNYAALGADPELWLEDPKGDVSMWQAATIRFMPRDNAKLCTDESGSNLFLVGEQKLPKAWLEECGYDVSKRFVMLGPLYAISYKTEKVFDGFQSTIYAHRLGEENSVLPCAIYDQEFEKILIVGGDYRIERKDHELGASPGIAN